MKRNLLIVIISLVCLALVFFAGFEYRGYVIAKAMSEALSNLGSTNNTSVSISPTKAPEQKVVTIEKGQEGKLSTLSIKVNSIKEAETLPQSFGQPATAKEGTKFVIVQIAATNITNSPFDFPSDITLIDDKNREFRVDVINYNPKDSLVYKSLSPSIPETGTLAYLVPKDAAGFFLQTMKASTRELYKYKTQ